MSTLNSPGIGSGLDVSAIVTAIVDAEMAPVESRLDRREEDLTVDISAFGQLQSSMVTFRSALTDLQRLSDFDEPTVSSSQTSIVTATASNDAEIGTHTITVNNTAKAQNISQGFTSPSPTNFGGEIKIELGTYDVGHTTFTAGSTPAVNITIDANSSLVDVKNAINSADAGVSASIINDGATEYLVLKGENTGAENAFRLTTISDDDGNITDGTGLSALNYVESSNATYSQNAQLNVTAVDSEVVLDGLTLNTQSNTLTDVIDGLTIELQSEDPLTTATLNVSFDTETVKTRITDFVDDFNTLFSTINDLTKYEVENGKVTTGELFGDSTARGIQSGLRSLLTTPVTNLSGSVTSLVDLGLSYNSENLIDLDESQLDNLLANNYEDVAKLFTFAATASDSSIDVESFSVTSEPNDYALTLNDYESISTLNSAGFSSSTDNVTSTAAGTFTIDIVTYTDATRTAISSTEASYTININQNSSLADIRNAINNSNAGTDPNYSVSARILEDNGKANLVITSTNATNGTGTSNALKITTTGADLTSFIYDPVSLTTNAEKAITGTINGKVMVSTADDNLLQATSSDFLGLSLDVQGGLSDAPATSRGTVAFTKGVGVLLDEFIDSYVDGVDGVLTQKLSSLNGEVVEVEADREAASDYRDRLETRYYRQFTALDAIVAQMESTSSFLSQQLSALDGSNEK
jgi:flagellar hook-associated protein 2